MIIIAKPYHRIQKALQWWSLKQSLKLSMEARKIREELLQELFIVRRNLELAAIYNPELSLEKIQASLKQIDSLHRSLAQLGDRLFPFDIEDNLPLAIEYLLEQWIISHPHLDFHVDMPLNWRYESAKYSLIVLNALEELLIITLSELITPTLINIKLQQKQHLAWLIVKITYSDISRLISCYHLQEFNYLCESFKALTSGKLFSRRKELIVIYYFYW